MGQTTNREPGIRDLADRLLLSVGTVSKALNNSGGVHEQTRRRVLGAAREMGYRPNLQARALRAKRSRCIGLILPSLAHSLYLERLDGLSETARRHGYELVMMSTQWDPSLEHEACSHLLNRQVEALILGGPMTSILKEEGPLQPFIQRQVPVIAIGAEPNQTQPMATLTVDRSEGMRQLVRHLTELGHRRLFLVGRWQEQLRRRNRLSGVRAGLAEAGLGEDALRLTPYASGLTMADGYATMREGLEGIRAEGVAMPTAVMSSDDEIALGAMAALQDHGLRVPGDVSITGFDGIGFAEFCRPSLTTVSQTHLALGRRAIEMALSLIEMGGPEEAALPHENPTLELIVRDSTAPPP